jgi:hypothetical protein
MKCFSRSLSNLVSREEEEEKVYLMSMSEEKPKLQRKKEKEMTRINLLQRFEEPSVSFCFLL